MNRFNGPCICGCGGERACHDCNEYSTHLEARCEGLLYQFFDEKVVGTSGEVSYGMHHRHIVMCPDHAETLDYTKNYTVGIN